MSAKKKSGCVSGCMTFVITVAIGFTLLVFVASRFKKPSGRDAVPAPPIAATADDNAREQSPTNVVGKPFDIRVTSSIVKKVRGRFRYFFDVRNHDSTPFDGSVRITLKNTLPTITNGHETFDTTSPIQPRDAKSVYLEVNTGPRAFHGDSSVESFEFVAAIRQQVVAEGKGTITAKIE